MREAIKMRDGMSTPGELIEVRSGRELARALFLDRDGVINEEVGYLHAAQDVRWVEGIFELARMAVELEYKLVVVTNQSGIARGLYTEAQFEALMLWMRAEFKAQGAVLSGVYHCPFHPKHGVGEYKREHEDRKPGTGMLRRAAKDLGLDLGRSVMVGDRCSDVEAANAAGLRKTFLLRGTEEGECAGNYVGVDSLSEVGEWLATATAPSVGEVVHVDRSSHLSDDKAVAKMGHPKFDKEVG